MTDLELLKQYAQTRSEAAFAELVRRHCDWVYSAAVRQVRDRQLAEDVAQGVFIALARQAKSLHRDQPLSPWLLRVARCAAISAVRGQNRRQRHEEKAAAMRPESTTTMTQADWEELAPILDEGVLRLAKKDREAILLRFYERKSLAEAGQAMGVSEKTAAKRVERALDKLRGQLAKKGLMAGAVALGVVMTQKVTEAAPAGLVKAATAAAGGSGAGSAAVIAKGAMKMMAWSKLSIHVGAIAVAVTLLLVSRAIGDGKPVATTQPAARLMPRSELTLVLGWNGQQVKLPGPAVYPQWGRDTWEFKRWLIIGDARTFTTTDVNGRRYELVGMGKERLPDGSLHEVVGAVSAYRADGTLEARGHYSSFDLAIEWQVYDASGANQIIEVSDRGTPPGQWLVLHVLIHEPNSMQREWRVNRFGVVYEEITRGRDGYPHFDHMVKELEDKPYPGTLLPATGASLWN